MKYLELWKLTGYQTTVDDDIIEELLKVNRDMVDEINEFLRLELSISGLTYDVVLRVSERCRLRDTEILNNKIDEIIK